MECSDSAEMLVKLALKAGDIYSAAAVHAIAGAKDKRKLEEVMFSKRRDALALARWEHTPPSVLEALVNTSDTQVVVRLDKNQNTPTKALSQLYDGVNERASIYTVLLAQHRHASLDVLKSIAQFEIDEASLVAVSKNKAASSEVLDILLNRFRSGSILEALQKNVSEHPSASAQILEQLYHEGGEYVKAAVVGHSQCSHQIIEQAVHDENVLIKRQLASDKRLSKEMIAKLSEHQDKSVRCALATNFSAPIAVVKLLAGDASEAVRRVVASRDDLTTHTMNRLLNDQDVWVRQRLARNPKALFSFMEKLSKDSQADVRRGVARNPRCPVKLLTDLAKDEDFWVRSAVAYQHGTPNHLLEQLVEDAAVDVLSGVASNANTPQRLLKKLAASDEADVRRGVILNMAATRMTLLPLLEDDYYLHRLMLVANHNLKDVDKWQLCFDPDDQVRFTAFKFFANRFIKSRH